VPGKDKPTKPLYNPSGYLASSTNPATWCSYEQAVAAARALESEFDGIGFFFSENDPYAGIDIDATNDATHRELHNRVWAAFPSYTERSPSGTGYHIIVKGSLPTGKRRMSVEVYSSARYFTMTGDVVRDAPIIDCQENLDILWQEMGGKVDPYEQTEDGGQLRSDDEIVTRAASAENKDKFNRLMEGDISGYLSQSEADQALLNILSFYTDSKSQVARIFFNSPLGQREKAHKHPSYVRNSIAKSFDRKLPPVDMKEIKEKLAELVKKPLKETKEYTNPETPWPPGLVGEIASYVYAQAPRQVKDIALVAGLGLMSGIAGQAFNVSGQGLNMYYMLIAGTGRGKEAISSGISKILNEISKSHPHARDFIGPGDMASGQGLSTWLEYNSCFVSIIGEFGIRLQAICAPNAPSHEQNLKKMFLDLYHKSGYGMSLQPSAYSTKQKREHVIIHRPAFSMIGESTPTRFYEALDETLIADGLIPRMLVVEYDGDRTYLSETHTNAEIPKSMTDKIVELVTQCKNLTMQDRVENVRFEREAEELLQQFEVRTTDLINAHKGSDVIGELYNRAHLKALRLAGVVAVGINFYAPTVSKEIAEWSIALVMRDVNNMLFRFTSGETASVHTGKEMKQVELVQKVISTWVQHPERIKGYQGDPEMIKQGAIALSPLLVRCGQMKLFKEDRRGTPDAVRAALKVIEDAGDIYELKRVEVKARFGRTAAAYQIANVDKFK